MPKAIGYAVMEAARAKLKKTNPKALKVPQSADDIEVVRPVKIPGNTLGEFLQNYCTTYDVSIMPAEGFIDETSKEAKYWHYTGQHDFYEVDGEILIDIHIERDYKTICPKQDLDFLLLETDIVLIPAFYAC